MSSTVFRELLSKTSAEVERPRNLADGHYIGEIKSIEFGTSAKKKTPFVRFNLTVEEETDDVPDGANEGIDFTSREIRKDVYVTPKSLYRLSDIIDAILGVDSNRNLDERLPEVKGVRVLFNVTSRPNEDGTEFYNDVGTVVAYDGAMADAAE